MGDEELLLRLTMPAEQVDAIGRPAPRPGRAPIVRLLEELAKRPVSYLKLEAGEDRIEYRRHAA